MRRRPLRRLPLRPALQAREAAWARVHRERTGPSRRRERLVHERTRVTSPSSLTCPSPSLRRRRPRRRQPRSPRTSHACGWRGQLGLRGSRASRASRASKNSESPGSGGGGTSTPLPFWRSACTTHAGFLPVVEQQRKAQHRQARAHVLVVLGGAEVVRAVPEAVKLAARHRAAHPPRQTRPPARPQVA